MRAAATTRPKRRSSANQAPALPTALARRETDGTPSAGQVRCLGGGPADAGRDSVCVLAAKATEMVKLQTGTRPQSATTGGPTRRRTSILPGKTVQGPSSQ